MKILDRLFCRHFYVFERNIHGDEIIAKNWKRSVWKCVDCGKEALRDKLHNVDKVVWHDVPSGFREGRRVKINSSSTFSRGCEGYIRFIEPNGTVWVRRDRSGADVMFAPHELDLLDDPMELVDLINEMTRS